MSPEHPYRIADARPSERKWTAVSIARGVLWTVAFAIVVVRGTDFAEFAMTRDVDQKVAGAVHDAEQKARASDAAAAACAADRESDRAYMRKTMKCTAAALEFAEAVKTHEWALIDVVAEACKDVDANDRARGYSR